jgi:outer membrane protein OmpA-like peptidoglycan-associated protein/thioredoxin-related protein
MKVPFTLLVVFYSTFCQSQAIDFRDLPFKEAQQVAIKEGKFLFVDFYTGWCRPCKEMEQTVFAVYEVGQFMNQHFISIRIEAEKDEAAIVQKLKIGAYPTMVFYDSKGKLMVRKEGALNSASFLELIHSLVKMEAYTENYVKRENDAETVYNYLCALRWTNENKANLIAKNYVKDLPEKKYEEEYNWKIIQRFISGTDAVLFPRVIANKKLNELYTDDFKAYALKGIQVLLSKAIVLPNQAMLNNYVRYIQTYPNFFPNPDSLKLVGRLAYAEKTQAKNFVSLLKEFVDIYEKKDPEHLAFLAIKLTEDYFNREILEYAIVLADQSNSQKPNANAYLATAMAYEKLNSFKNAYANLLLGYQYADDEMRGVLDQYEVLLERKLKYEFVEGVNASTERGDDGRFTLGAGDKRLMYGYPLPKSTSHFIINVNGKLASNAPHLQSKGVVYLKGPMAYEGTGSAQRISITFEFEKVRVTQLLTPVDKNGIEINYGLAQYYKISYRVENLDGQGKVIGLGLLFDTMIDDNDYCTIEADKRMVTTEKMFTLAGVPKELLLYRTRADTSDVMGAAILSGLDTTPPDKLLIGRWPVLHEVSWKLSPEKSYIGDSGYFMQWENRHLTPSGKLEFITYYGIPKHKAANLRIIMEGESHLTRTETVYFEHQSDELDLNAKMKIEQLVKQEGIVITGVLLNGYADITGDDNYNFKLSQRRIENIGSVLKAYGVAFVPKPYGIEQAENHTYNKLFGNAWDRKVEIVLYYKRKGTDVLSQIAER